MKVYFNGQFKNDKRTIQDWITRLAAKHPTATRIMAGPGVEIGKHTKHGIYFDSDIDENIVVRITPSGMKIAGLGDGESYSFEHALHESGIVGANARAVAPDLERFRAKQ